VLVLQLNQMEVELQSMQQELAQVQKEREVLENQRRVLKTFATDPCIPGVRRLRTTFNLHLKTALRTVYFKDRIVQIRVPTFVTKRNGIEAMRKSNNLNYLVNLT